MEIRYELYIFDSKNRDLICDLIKKNFTSDLKKVKSRQISCLLTDAERNAQIVETLLPRMQFNAKTAPYNWLTLYTYYDCTKYLVCD